MNWKNLKENKCPQCDKPFESLSFQKPGIIVCMRMFPKECFFTIREKRYSEIVNSQITQDLEDKWNEEFVNS